MSKNDMGMDRFKQIQEIILGEFADAWEKKLEDINKRLAQLNSTMEHNFSTFDQRLQELESALNSRIGETESGLTKKITTLRSDFETFRDTFSTETAQGLGRKLDIQTISSLFAELSDRLQNHDSETAG